MKVWLQNRLPVGGEPGRAAEDDLDLPFEVVLAGDADGEVVEAVAVEVAGGERPAEQVARPRPRRPCPRRPGRGGRGVLEVETVAEPGMTTTMPWRSWLLQTGVQGTASLEVLAGHADDEVVEAVGVEVAAGEAPAEAVVGFHVSRHAAPVLREEEVAGLGRPPAVPRWTWTVPASSSPE